MPGYAGIMVMTDRSIIEQLLGTFEAEAAGERKAVPMPWPVLSQKTQALRPGTVTLLAGSPGIGKSFFGLELCIDLMRQGVEFFYFPLEDSKLDYMRRVLAVLSGEWFVVEVDEHQSKKRADVLLEHELEMESMKQYIMENVLLDLEHGLDWEGAIELVAGLQGTRVVMLDPISQIDWGKGKEYRAQEKFMRAITKVAAETGTSVVLFHHLKKRKATERTQYHMDDMGGSHYFARLAHTVLLLTAHEKKVSQVMIPGGCTLDREHNKTVYIEKARNGSGTGSKVAFSVSGPSFQEHGIIVRED